jgi:hypothetical protein
MDNTKKRELMIFLSVDLKQAGSDMIELVGEINGMFRLDHHISSWKLKDLEEAVAKAQRSLEHYKRAVAADKETLTRAEYEAA